MKLYLITCILERGKADNVIDAAIAAGAQAATYFFARGRGLRERIGFFGKFIQAEKEVILIVTTEVQQESVFNAVVSTAELNTPGKGFAYIQPVEHAVGFVDGFCGRIPGVELDHVHLRCLHQCASVRHFWPAQRGAGDVAGARHGRARGRCAAIAFTATA